MPYVDAHGVKVHYVDHGGVRPSRRTASATSPGTVAERSTDLANERPTIVFLHGFTVDHRLMTGCFEPVLGEYPEIRRIYLDLPGMGATLAPDHIRTTDDVLTTVMAAIDTLVPGRFALAGESYGGYVARGVVAQDPERVDGLMLLCPLMEPDPQQRVLPRRQILVRDPALVAQVGARVLDEDNISVVQTMETWRRTQEDVTPGINAGDVAVLDRLSAAYAGTFATEDTSRPFRAPTLLLAGRQDSITGYSELWDALESYPRATFAVLDRAGHNLQIEQPALFAALVIEWLNRVLGHRARGGLTQP